MTRWLRFLIIAALGLAATAPVAVADIYVHLKDGRVMILPVSKNDLDYIEIRPDSDKGDKGSAPSDSGNTVRLSPPQGSAEESAARLPDGGEFRQGGPHKPQTYRVGPDQKYKKPSDLERIAQDGDTIEIEAGVYKNDWAEWDQNNLTLRGVGGRAHLESSGYISNEKAIWIIDGDNVTVENIEFSGARVRDVNGAGIRAEGGKLVVKNSYFHDNEFGLLSDDSGRGDITIENSEFVHQIRQGTYAHNIYVGRAKRFRLTGSYIVGAVGGHQVKARGLENYIAYNRIMDGKDGNGSYAIDLPDCGTSYVIGNVIQQGRNSENHTGISYGAEHCDPGRPRAAYIVNNTFVNDAPLGTFVTNHISTPLVLRNNLIVGIARLADGPVKDDNNLLELRESFANRDTFDFHLAKGAAAINKGIAPGKADTGVSLVPVLEYKAPLGTAPRKMVGKPDMGAFEYHP